MAMTGRMTEPVALYGAPGPLALDEFPCKASRSNTMTGRLRPHEMDVRRRDVSG